MCHFGFYTPSYDVSVRTSERYFHGQWLNSIAGDVYGDIAREVTTRRYRYAETPDQELEGWLHEQIKLELIESLPGRTPTYEAHPLTTGWGGIYWHTDQTTVYITGAGSYVIGFQYDPSYISLGAPVETQKTGDGVKNPGGIHGQEPPGVFESFFGGLGQGVSNVWDGVKLWDNDEVDRVYKQLLEQGYSAAEASYIAYGSSIGERIGVGGVADAVDGRTSLENGNRKLGTGERWLRGAGGVLEVGSNVWPGGRGASSAKRTAKQFDNLADANQTANQARKASRGSLKRGDEIRGKSRGELDAATQKRLDDKRRGKRDTDKENKNNGPCANPLPGGVHVQASTTIGNGGCEDPPLPTNAESVAKAEPVAAEVAKPSTLLPGPNARESIPAHRGRPTAEEQRQVNELFNKHGCHTCGTKSPGTKSGNAIADHQPPQALDEPKKFFPHCIDCARRQGGEVLQEKLRNQLGQ